MSRISELLGSQYPVIQGAMGVICNPELVAAVSEAGGFGLLATSFAEDPEAVRDQARKTKEITDKPFGANVTLQYAHARENAEVCLEEKVPVINWSLGKADWLIKAAHEYKVDVALVGQRQILHVMTGTKRRRSGVSPVTDRPNSLPPGHAGMRPGNSLASAPDTSVRTR